MTVQEHRTISDELAGDIGRLVAASDDSVDNPPISEHGLLQVRDSTAATRHFVASASGAVTGYAQLDSAEQPPAAELVAADDAAADELLGALSDAADDFRLWAHGSHSVATGAAERAGLTATRTLLQLRRSLPDWEPAAVPQPPDVLIRPFVPGQDDAAWLGVNARAFAHHPEQGAWTQHDLDERIASSWFDATGFLLAERDSQLLGYHWTKVHTAPGTESIGEVYVLGVDPSAQGLRLGKLLLNAGLAYLKSLGLGAVLLYVEQDNPTALGLYERAGFTVFARDIQYASLPIG